MYRLLTADDEPDKLEALRNLYDWAGCRVEICGEAGDGVDAYEQIVAKKPDICIMDIRMPLLSGLEVIERARKAGSVTKYIILSGYDEFDYAKEAIGLSVVDYLLKPCRCENIVQSVQKCIRLIEQEKKQRKLQEDYRHLLKNSLGNERERLLCDLILGNPVENLESRKRECCLSALGNTVAVCVFDASGGNSAQDRLPELRGETETALTAVRPAVVLNFRDQVVAVVGMDGITDGFEAFRGGLKNAADRCYRLCGISCAAGVSECKQGFEFLHSAYLEAKQAVETLKFLFGRNILFFAELNGPGAPPLPENPEQPFLRNLADAAATEKLADRFLAACNTCSMDVKEGIRRYPHLQSLSVLPGRGAFLPGYGGTEAGCRPAGHGERQHRKNPVGSGRLPFRHRKKYGRIQFHLCACAADGRLHSAELSKPHHAGVGRGGDSCDSVLFVYAVQTADGPEFYRVCQPVPRPAGGAAASGQQLKKL